MFKCELDKELNKCPYYNDGFCKNEDKCSFQKRENTEVRHSYVRKERWYEQYYKR